MNLFFQRKPSDSSSTSIRQARADDAPFLAWAILTASRGHLPRGWFDIALNRTESECLEFLKQLTVTPTRSLWHYSRFLIAETDSSPVSTLCAFDAANTYSVSPVAFVEAVEALRFPPDEQTSIWERGAYAFYCTVPPGEGCFVIDSVATLPTQRLRGHTAALLARALELGRAQGFAEAQITFLIGNEAAERSYRRAGFELAGERRHPDFERVASSPGLYRFVKAL